MNLLCDVNVGKLYRVLHEFLIPLVNDLFT